MEPMAQQPVMQQPVMMEPMAQQPVMHEAPASMQPLDGQDAPKRTASRGGGAGGMQNVGNSIGDIPSVKLHAPPGGSSSISFGQEIDSNTTAAMDKSDTAAVRFLQETNAKFSASAKLSVRDFHMLGSFPLFEAVYNEWAISRMSYAEKI